MSMFKLNSGWIKRIGSLFVTTVVGLTLGFAAVFELPVTEVKGIKCYYYDVAQGESVYQVSNKLRITREQLIKYNPSAADGLKPKMRLYFPVADFPKEENQKAIYAAAAGVSTHVVKRGETIYGIAHKYGMSPDELVRLNPSANEGLRVGQELVITEETPELELTQLLQAAKGKMSDDGSYYTYVIQKGETLFGVANRNGIDLEVLLASNPTLDPVNYQAGTQVIIPVNNSPVAAALEAAAPVASASAPASEIATAAPFVPKTSEVAAVQTPALTEEAIFTQAVDPDRENLEDDAPAQEPLEIGVMLPFMLSEETQSRTTQLFTEFYKGMLMAADTLRNASGAPVNIRFYDTANNLDTLVAILNRPEISTLDLIVAPDNASHIGVIMRAVEPTTLVLNVFAVKDETFRNYRNLIQSNIPHDAMYESAIEAFMQKYAGFTPVFISRTGGTADKESFTTRLKERLKNEGRDFKEINYSGFLRGEDLALLMPDVEPVVFVPGSGSKTEFAKYAKALLDLRRNSAEPANVTIFGYPEWVTFRDDSFEEICNLGATIYSRFYANENDLDTRALKDRYRQWFGVDMFDAVPSQGVLGYDTGVFVINGLRTMEASGVFPEEFDGTQSFLRLAWSDSEGGNKSSLAGSTTADDADAAIAPYDSELEETVASKGGLVNEGLFLINYNPGGIVEKVKL